MKGGKKEKEKMKKLFLFLVMISLVIGVMGAAIGQQGVDVIVNPQTTVTITPISLSFGPVIQGTQDNLATNNPITFTPQPGANQDLNVEFTAVDVGTLFEQIELEINSNWVLITSHPDIDIPCVLSQDPIPVCTYTPATVNARLDVPQGYPSGSHSGTITYTITGQNP